MFLFLMATECHECLVHVSRYPFTSVIEARGTSIDNRSFMRSLVHFSLGKIVQDDPERRIEDLKCAVIMPFTAGMKGQVKSFHPNDVTFLGDVALLPGSTVFYKSTGAPIIKVESVIYEEVENLSDAVAKEVLKYTKFTIPTKVQELFVDDWFFDHSRFPGLNPQSGLGLASANNLHEVMSYLNSVFLMEETPAVMKPLIHSLIKGYIQKYPKVGGQLKQRYCDTPAMKVYASLDTEEFFEKILDFDKKITSIYTLQTLISAPKSHSSEGCLILLNYLFSLSHSMFKEITEPLELCEDFRNTLTIGNLSHSALRIMLRLALRNKLKINNAQSDDVIANFITGSAPWAPRTKKQLEEQLASAEGSISELLKKSINRELFEHMMFALMTHIDGFMIANFDEHKEKNITQLVPGALMPKFGTFMKTQNVKLDVFRKLADQTNKYIQEQNRGSSSRNVIDANEDFLTKLIKMKIASVHILNLYRASNDVEKNEIMQAMQVRVATLKESMPWLF